MSFAERFKELRLKRGWTQEEVASRLGTTRNSISYYEDPPEGKKGTPALETLVKIADVFNVTTDFLLEREEAQKHYFSKDTLNDEDQDKLDRFLNEARALYLEGGGNVSDDDMSSAMKFIGYLFRRDLDVEKKDSSKRKK